MTWHARTLSSGSACSRNQPTTAWPASWNATVRRSTTLMTLFFFSRPPMMRSTAASKSTMLTASLADRAAISAASLHTLAMSAPAKPAMQSPIQRHGRLQMQRCNAARKLQSPQFWYVPGYGNGMVSREESTWRQGGHALRVVLDWLVQLDLLQVHPEDLFPPGDVWPVDADLPVKSARPQQRLRRT